MIVELALGAAVLAASSAMVRAVLARRARIEAARDEARKQAGSAEKRGARGLRPGDVLMLHREELVVVGALELDEQGHVVRVARVIGGVGAGRSGATWVLQLDPDARELAALSESRDIPEGAVPDGLPLGGRLLRLVRRGKARVVREGDELPAIGATATYTILAERGGRTAIVIDSGQLRLALAGDRLDTRMVELLPGGDLPR